MPKAYVFTPFGGPGTASSAGPGRLLARHVARTHPLHETDAALRAVEEGHARGETVIGVAE